MISNQGKDLRASSILKIENPNKVVYHVLDTDDASVRNRHTDQFLFDDTHDDRIRECSNRTSRFCSLCSKSSRQTTETGTSRNYEYN